MINFLGESMLIDGRGQGVVTSRGSSGLACTNKGTCAPLPFHVTSGQPAVGQGVVVHVRGSNPSRVKIHIFLSDYRDFLADRW
ncbi:unnamed protein product [Spirodela intermedia]|uniref:Galectin n=1 Tax=Spirodela intermedia TaxID=51605 RepID=A0ABN7EE49_SPIIN|nr:unnamed protein product [Spirodela intermedia]